MQYFDHALSKTSTFFQQKIIEKELHLEYSCYLSTLLIDAVIQGLRETKDILVKVVWSSTNLI